MAHNVPNSVEIAWRDAVDNLRFLKQQQWAITRNVLTVQAALFAVRIAFKAPQDIVTWLLMFGCVLACLSGTLIVANTERSMDKFRGRLRWIYRQTFSENEINGMNLHPGSSWLDHLGFHWICGTVMAGGAIISSTSICWLPSS